MKTILIADADKDGVLEESYTLSDFWLEREFTDGALRLLIDRLQFSNPLALSLKIAPNFGIAYGSETISMNPVA